MSTRSAFRFDPTAFIGSFVFGVIFVVLFTWMNGNAFGAPTFPLLAMTSGFILAGIAYGYLSTGETVLEPAVAAIVVAVVSYYIIAALNLRAFSGLNGGEFTYLMVVSFLNGLVFTFVGAWAGEKLERTYDVDSEVPAMQWGWIVAGVVLGFAVSLFLVNFVIWFFGLFGSPFAALESGNVWVLLFVVFFGLLATGYVCAFRSPGDTSYEAAVSGLITLILLFDVFVFTLQGDEVILSLSRMALLLVIGLLASLLGGYVGEWTQIEVEGPEPSGA